MNLSSETLDDLLTDVYTDLTNRPFDISSTRGQTSGDSSEAIGAKLTLRNPRARLSRTEIKGTFFSALGELLWYLAKTDELEFIKYYISRYEKESSNGRNVHGAYGPRLFNSQGKFDQIRNVISLLQNRASSRRAAIQIFEASDLADSYVEIPCTCTLQFLQRNEKLHMVTYMRSNDAYLGLPHDIFSFTMIQEIIARSLGIEVGEYIHLAGSLHLYSTNKDDVEYYFREGAQSTIKNMPPMPLGDPWPSIDQLLIIEEKIRKSEDVDIEKHGLDPYWQDLAYSLQIYGFYLQKKADKIAEVQSKFSSKIYNTFIEKKLISLTQNNKK